MMKRKNLFYAQAGGVTAVINATAASVIEIARRYPEKIGRVLAGRHGILGVLREELLETSALSCRDLSAISRLPGGVFGSCRFELELEQTRPAQYDRLFDVFAAHGIGFFLYNGGNGSMDVVVKLSRAARRRGYPLVCVGIPKTIDNDLEGSDCSPGFASAAKYVATSVLEAGRDLSSMGSRVGRVFVLEVMGRNTGWLAAASVLAAREQNDPPHIVLLPEVPLNRETFLARVREMVERLGFCVITASEGIRYADGSLVMEQHHDHKGHIQLGGAGQQIARLIQAELGYKHHWAIPDYLQRAAGHLISAVDYAHARAVGRAAVEYALAGRDGMMPAIRRLSDCPYRWDIQPVSVAEIANLERLVPSRFITPDGMYITEAGRAYLQPLIEGELPPLFRHGLPAYPVFRLPLLPRRLPLFSLSQAVD